MIKYNNTNNASTTLTAWISPSSTTLIVENGDILPTAPFLLTLEHFDNEKVTVREIVKCIAKVGTILTIQRGAGTCVQDDSATPKAQNNTPHSFSVWDVASIYWTSEQVQDIQDEIERKLNISDFQAWTYVYGATSGGTDTYEITLPWTITSYQLGQVFRFMADTWNDWNAYLNVNGLGALEIFKNHDKHLETEDIEAGQIVVVAYDWTAFQMNSEVATVVELSEINSLNYKDTTCYAWESIRSNDLIVTNGNSFDASRTDESVSVGGADNNKYAIWFIANGENAENFTIKTSLIEEGVEPDAVTVNLETDDNWKPSGTVLQTSSSLSSLKGIWINFWSLVETSITSADRNNIWDFFLNVIWEDATFSGWTLSSKSVSLDFSWFTWAVQLYSISNDDKYFIFIDTSNNPSISTSNIITVIYTPNRYSIEWATVLCSLTFADLRTALWWGNYGYLYNIFYDDTGTKIIASWRLQSPNSTWTCANLTTPFDLTTITNPTDISVWSYRGKTFGFIKTIENKYWVVWNICTSNYSNYQYYYVWIQEIDMDTFSLVWSVYTTYRYFMWYKHIRYDKDKMPFFYVHKNESWDTYYRVRLWAKFSTTPCKANISFTSQTLEEGKKYWITIAPTLTWSVVDLVKIYDKEWNYYSETALRDLNVWRNTTNKTPYIDWNCIFARYARKVNDNDTIWNIGWFAIWDFTEFETVSYCFKGVLGWFQNLDPDKRYFSNSDWSIWKVWDIEVGRSVDWWKLIVNIKNSINPSLKDSDFTFTVASSSTSTETKTFYASRNEIAFVIYKGVWTIKVNWQLVKNFSKTTDEYFNIMLYKRDYVEITLARYDSSNGWSVRFKF